MHFFPRIKISFRANKMVRATFSYDRSQREGRHRLFWVTLLVVFIVLIDIVSGGRVRGLVKTAAAEVWTVSARVRAGVFENGYFSSRSSLAAENAALREALSHAQEDAASYQALKDENQELRAIVHLAGGTPGVTAPIVSSVFSSPYGTLLIGADSGTVSPDDVVLTADNFAVARVESVNGNTATAAQVFAPNNTVNVLIGSKAAQAEGRGGGNARAKLPRDASVHVGDVVTSPELGGRPVGIVGKVDSSPAASEQTIYISLPVDLSALKFVYIVH
jgi:cell shape-determining protein MreC